MAVGYSPRRMAHTVLFVVGAFVIGDVLHRSLVTGEIELLAAEPVARIALGAVILLAAHLIRSPRERRETAWEAGGDEAPADDGAGDSDA